MGWAVLRVLTTIVKWAVLVPLLVLSGGCLFVLDQLLPRYLLAALLLAPVWALAYFVWGTSLKPFYFASIVLGTLLAGLWENCDAFSGRSILRLLTGVWRK
jgi:hypothetical protein